MMHGQIKFTDVSAPVIQLPAGFRRVRMERHGSHLTDFYEIRHLNIFLKTLEKIQVSLKSYKNNECFTCRPIHIFGHISLSSSKIEKCFKLKL